mmetsp:Transcript_64551/g.154209  ORF Transcript_64551/g.154209 Transcript_64551/m.154209 type:complete len:503 (+) Transcript_64551:269-1777(+)
MCCDSQQNNSVRMVSSKASNSEQIQSVREGTRLHQNRLAASPEGLDECVILAIAGNKSWTHLQKGASTSGTENVKNLMGLHALRDSLSKKAKKKLEVQLQRLPRALAALQKLLASMTRERRLSCVQSLPPQVRHLLLRSMEAKLQRPAGHHSRPPPAIEPHDCPPVTQSVVLKPTDQCCKASGCEGSNDDAPTKSGDKQNMFAKVLKHRNGAYYTQLTLPNLRITTPTSRDSVKVAKHATVLSLLKESFLKVRQDAASSAEPTQCRGLAAADISLWLERAAVREGLSVADIRLHFRAEVHARRFIGKHVYGPFTQDLEMALKQRRQLLEGLSGDWPAFRASWLNILQAQGKSSKRKLTTAAEAAHSVDAARSNVIFARRHLLQSERMKACRQPRPKRPSVATNASKGRGSEAPLAAAQASEVRASLLDDRVWRIVSGIQKSLETIAVVLVTGARRLPLRAKETKKSFAKRRLHANIFAPEQHTAKKGKTILSGDTRSFAKLT